ncbi:unnamed protein product [Acanthoscelides obtectus]|uniref:Uncharacterized protein n=1 Tax=Acanthoscelides obtectus TaxID=200917 RepID=A0A9P0K3E0_ACAOB|nr:unnamed protein product [Acanthoscelides obtectus]CAK1622754.1 hypothetical protein AOBTE_LOCUS1656 [Acanthoscelides obtectus]
MAKKQRTKKNRRTWIISVRRVCCQIFVYPGNFSGIRKMFQHNRSNNH